MNSPYDSQAYTREMVQRISSKSEFHRHLSKNIPWPTRFLFDLFFNVTMPRIILQARCCKLSLPNATVGCLRNNNDNGNENSKKAIGVDWQNKNCVKSLHEHDMKVPNFTFCGNYDHKTTTIFLFFELQYSSLEFST